jgi:hypothetical protein
VVIEFRALFSTASTGSNFNSNNIVPAPSMNEKPFRKLSSIKNKLEIFGSRGREGVLEEPEIILG